MVEQNKDLNIFTDPLENSAIGDENFQVKLVKLLVDGDEKFSEQIIDIIKAEYFDNTNIKIIVSYILKHINEHNGTPCFDTIRDLINHGENQSANKKYLIETLNGIEKIKVVDKSYIESSALEFCKKQSLKNGILKAAEVWGKGDYDGIVGVINEAMKAGEPKNCGHDYFEDIDKRLTKEHRKPISALPGLDAKIGGGLAGGELGIVLSPTGGGKSMMLVKFATTALKNGKNIVYYTLELKEKVIGNRVDSCLCEVSLTNVLQYEDIIKGKLKDVKQAGGRLFIKEYSSGTATVNTLANDIKLIERDHKVKIDLIIVDYADLLKSTSSYSERRFNLTDIYVRLRGMAMELDVPLWSASQGNRCVDINTIVHTKNGDIKIVNLKEGDCILTHKGFKKVLVVSNIMKKPAYKIKTKSEKEIICSFEHRFPVFLNYGAFKSIEGGLSIGDMIFTKGQTNADNVDLNVDEIESIEFVGDMDMVDIQVEDTKLFFANDIYTHNSTYDAEYFGVQSISESLGKAETADVIIGVARTPKEKEAKKATLLLLKNRLGEDGFKIPLYFDTTSINIGVLSKEEDAKFKLLANNAERQITEQDTDFGNLV